METKALPKEQVSSAPAIERDIVIILTVTNTKVVWYKVDQDKWTTEAIGIMSDLSEGAVKCPFIRCRHPVPRSWSEGCASSCFLLRKERRRITVRHTYDF